MRLSRRHLFGLAVAAPLAAALPARAYAAGGFVKARPYLIGEFNGPGVFVPARSAIAEIMYGGERVGVMRAVKIADGPITIENVWVNEEHAACANSPLVMPDAELAATLGIGEAHDA